MNIIKKEYKDYAGTEEGFDLFNKEVINMPRDDFSSVGLKKIQQLAGYLLLTQGKLSEEGEHYKGIHSAIKSELDNGNHPVEDKRSVDFETDFFGDQTYDDLNETSKGRLYRHNMEICAFFGLLETTSGIKKRVEYSKCKEYYLSNEEELMPILRNNMVMVNANNNCLINNLQSIDITEDTDYRPAYAIMRYIQEMKRPVTKFEISVLLGRIDKVKKEKDIINRALRIGKILPQNEREQKETFFEGMEWRKDGKLLEYGSSQSPDFKFKPFILWLKQFELLKEKELESTYELTEYAKELLDDDVSYLIADLERLLETVDDYERDNSELSELIIQQRNPELLRMAKNEENFYKKMNIRSINNPIRNKKGKRIRNRLIAELAKIEADYTCQYAQRKTFKNTYDKYYCEAHHIIEFSTEKGPDITNNLIVLGPEAHMRIHHGNTETVKETYLQLAKNGALDISRFEEMITIYNCLKKEHINILNRKGIITESEKDDLLELLEQNKKEME